MRRYDTVMSLKGFCGMQLLWTSMHDTSTHAKRRDQPGAKAVDSLVDALFSLRVS